MSEIGRKGKIRKQSGILNLIWYSLTPRALRSLYYSLVYPMLTYCHTVWGGSSSNMLQPLFISQKRVLRIISNLKWRDHTNNAFKHHKILKFHDLNIYCSVMYVFKSIHGLGTGNNQTFTSSFNTNYNLRTENLLRIPQLRSSQSQTARSFNGAKLWNDLPLNIRNAISLPLFKNSLKRYLLAQYDLTTS